MYNILGCIKVLILHTSRPRIIFSHRKQARAQASDRKWNPVCTGMNRLQSAEIRVRCFIIIVLWYDSSLKVVFRHYAFHDTNLLKKFEPNAAKRTEERRGYDRLMEHVV